LKDSRKPNAANLLRMKPWKLSFVAFGNEASTFRAGGF